MMRKNLHFIKEQTIMVNSSLNKLQSVTLKYTKTPCVGKFAFRQRTNNYGNIKPGQTPPKCNLKIIKILIKMKREKQWIFTSDKNVSKSTIDYILINKK